MIMNRRKSQRFDDDLDNVTRGSAGPTCLTRYVEDPTMYACCCASRQSDELHKFGSMVWYASKSKPTSRYSQCDSDNWDHSHAIKAYDDQYSVSKLTTPWCIHVNIMYANSCIWMSIMTVSFRESEERPFRCYHMTYVHPLDSDITIGLRLDF